MSTVLSARAWETVWTYRATFVQGLLNTLETAGIALVIALIIGFTLGLFSTSGHKALKAVARVYVEFFQNTPLILQVCFLYYVLAYSGMGLPVIVVGFISLGLYHGAYISEVVRSGIEAVPAGQFDAAHSQGFEYFVMMRYIILPQAFHNIVPTLLSQMITTIKDSSYMASLATIELMARVKLIISKANKYNGTWLGPMNRGTIHVSDVFVLFGLAFLTYFIINFSLSLVVRRLKKKRKPA